MRLSLRRPGTYVLAITAVLMFGGPRAKAQTPVFPQTQTDSLPQLSGISVSAPVITDLNNDQKPDLVALGSADVYAILDITNP